MIVGLNERIANNVWFKIALGSFVLIIESISLIFMWPGGIADFFYPMLAISIGIIAWGLFGKWSLKKTCIVFITSYAALIVFICLGREYQHRHAWDSGVPTQKLDIRY